MVEYADLLSRIGLCHVGDGERITQLMNQRC